MLTIFLGTAGAYAVFYLALPAPSPINVKVFWTSKQWKYETTRLQKRKKKQWNNPFSQVKSWMYPSCMQPKRPILQFYKLYETEKYHLNVSISINFPAKTIHWRRWRRQVFLQLKLSIQSISMCDAVLRWDGEQEECVKHSHIKRVHHFDPRPGFIDLDPVSRVYFWPEA